MQKSIGTRGLILTPEDILMEEIFIKITINRGLIAM
jgi:hypothetical protein